MRSVTILALILAAPLAAQPPRGMFNWWESPLARDVKLTDDQQRQIRDTVREFRSKSIDVRGAVEKAEIEVEDVFNEDNLDQRRASEAIERLVNARGDLTRAFSQLSLRLRSVLTAEQWRELQRRRQSEQRMGPGQNMPGMQGGPGRQGMPGMRPGLGPPINRPPRD